MKISLTLAIALAASLLTSTTWAADVDLTGIKCPITGKQAVAKGKVDYKGKVVYTCCTKCPKAFAKNPDKFAVNANAQLVATKQAVQVSCPISGKAVNPEVQVEVAGTKIGLCCKHCLKKVVSAEGDAQLALVFANFDKAFTTQTTCPISKKAINPKFFAEADGKKTYFCCGKCKPVFEKKSS